MTNGLRAETRRVSMLLPVIFAGLLETPTALAQEATPPAPPETTPPPAGETPTPEGGASLDIEVVAKRLNEARINIEPRIGASTYTLTPEAIQNLPEAQNTPIDNAILQMPGVDQDNLANGGLHIRNEHLNVQYRIDGVIIPDGVSFFGQDLSLRFIDRMTLITGTLPPEYGLRTAGIIDIQSKSGLQPGRLSRSVWRELRHPQSELRSGWLCRRL